LPLNLSRFSKRLAVIILVVVTVASFSRVNEVTASSGPLQTSQGSPAYAAAFWLWGGGGYNEVDVMTTNVGAQSATLCFKDWASNGTEIVSTCSKEAIAPFAQWRFRLFAPYIGYSGTIIVYSQDSVTPIAPYGQVTIDQNGNKIVDAAVGLQWVPISPPSS